MSYRKILRSVKASTPVLAALLCVGGFLGSGALQEDHAPRTVYVADPPVVIPVDPGVGESEGSWDLIWGS